MVSKFRSRYQRQILLTVSGLALLALTALAAGLSRTEFRSAVQYVEAQTETAGEDAGELQAFAVEPSSGRDLLIFLAGMVVLTVIGLTSKEGRKRVLWTILWFALMLFTAYILSKNSGVEAVNFVETPQPPGLAAEPNVLAEATEVPFEPPQSNPVINYLVSFGLVSLLGVGVWLAWRLTRPQGSPALHEIGYAARLALNELESNHDWQDAVVRAYVRMSEIVTRQRGLQRPDGMTVSEFALRLERAGLPADSVKRLTRLFESVRYGGRGSSQSQVLEASSCLTAIVEACGGEA